MCSIRRCRAATFWVGQSFTVANVYVGSPLGFDRAELQEVAHVRAILAAARATSGGVARQGDRRRSFAAAAGGFARLSRTSPRAKLNERSEGRSAITRMEHAIPHMAQERVSMTAFRATIRCCPGPRALRRPDPVSSGRCDRR